MTIEKNPNKLKIRKLQIKKIIFFKSHSRKKKYIMKNFIFKSKFSFFYISQAVNYPKALPRVFFDIKIGTEKSQKVIIEVYQNH